MKVTSKKHLNVEKLLWLLWFRKMDLEISQGLAFFHSKQLLRSFSLNDITVRLDSSSLKPGELFFVCYCIWKVLNDICLLVPVVAFTLAARATINYKGRECKIHMLKTNRWGIQLSGNGKIYRGQWDEIWVQRKENRNGWIHSSLIVFGPLFFPPYDH